MDQDCKRILQGLQVIHKNVERLRDDLGQKYLSNENFKIYHEVINKDLNGLGNMIRNLTGQVKELELKNAQQDLQHNTLATKVGTILGIIGGTSGIGALLYFGLKNLLE